MIDGSVSDEYCPYEIMAVPEMFGLTAKFEDTIYGPTRIVKSAVTSSSATIFLHGVGGSWSSWTPLLQYLVVNNHDIGDVLILDIPGFGESTNRLGELKVEVLGDEILKLFRRQGWSSARLIGHSMGGFLALDMASRDHVEIESVSVISGAYYSVISTVQNPLHSLIGGSAAARAYLTMSTLAKFKGAANALLHLLFWANLLPYVLSATVKHPHRLKASVLKAIADNLRPDAFVLAAANGKEYDPGSQWAKITVPLRASFGEADSLVPPSDAVPLMENVPHAQIRVLADVGHFAQVEHPDQVADFLFSDDGPSVFRE